MCGISIIKISYEIYSDLFWKIEVKINGKDGGRQDK
jgi:hypothetical protein